MENPLPPPGGGSNRSAKPPRLSPKLQLPGPARRDTAPWSSPWPKSWLTQWSAQWPTQWKEEQLFFQGDAYLESLLSGIRAARRTIDFECYIFEADAVGMRIVNALKEAAKREVRVRLLVDGLGSFNSISKLREELAGSKVLFKVYHPVGFGELPDVPRWLDTLNRRNHRKSCVIDGELAWVGSMNVSEVHSETHRGADAWRDTAIRVRGAEVVALLAAYEKAWRRCTRGFHRHRRRSRRYRYLGYRALSWFRKAGSHGRHILLNHTIRLRMRRHAELVGRITSAQKRVWLTTPYFVPGIQLLRALRIAAACGADVRILLPTVSDVPIVRWVGAVFEEGLLRVGVRIFHYKPSILHAKTVLIDDWATVGSSNLNHRSIIHDLEVDVVIDRRERLDELSERYLRDLQVSDEATVESLRSRSWLGRLAGAFGMLLRYWM